VSSARIKITAMITYYILYLLAYYMKHSPSWEVHVHTQGQVFADIYRTWRFTTCLPYTRL